VQDRLAQGQSQRAVAEALGVARSTLQDWLGQAPSDEVPAALRQFYASAEGVAWLHRQVLAAHLVITMLAGAGVRQVCTFLELSGLSAFAASSYGSQHKLNAALEEAVVDRLGTAVEVVGATRGPRRTGALGPMGQSTKPRAGRACPHGTPLPRQGRTGFYGLRT
jgi:transcriptional regulator with XRE-family HTH domain